MAGNRGCEFIKSHGHALTLDTHTHTCQHTQPRIPAYTLQTTLAAGPLLLPPPPPPPLLFSLPFSAPAEHWPSSDTHTQQYETGQGVADLVGSSLFSSPRRRRRLFSLLLCPRRSIAPRTWHTPKLNNTGAGVCQKQKNAGTWIISHLLGCFLFGSLRRRRRRICCRRILGRL